MKTIISRHNCLIFLMNLPYVDGHKLIFYKPARVFSTPATHSRVTYPVQVTNNEQYRCKQTISLT